MPYTKTFKEQCFKLYCTNQPVDSIAQQKQVSKQTLWQWIKQYNWQQRKTTIQQQATKNLDESLTETIARHIKTLQFIQGKGIKNIQEGSQKVIPKDVIESIKQEILLSDIFYS